MNYSLLSTEILVALLGLVVLLADLWLPAGARRHLGLAAAGGLIAILFLGFRDAAEPAFAFVAPGSGAGLYVDDSLAVFFKQFFLIAGILVLVIASGYADRLPGGVSEYYSLILFALLGMLFAASANDFSLLFVSLELITITFVILNSFQRNRQASLEAGVKYLIMGGVASAFMVFGIALVFGAAGTTNFTEIFQQQATLASSRLFLTGLLLVLVGLGFKIAAFPFQMWAPDVYQGAPAPSVAFLAVGSKAAGFVLLLRVLFGVVPAITAGWSRLFALLAALTILYGVLCALPQRSLKRLMGYSSIANAGFLLLGVVATNAAGTTAILYYLAGYLFTVLAAFTVIALVLQNSDNDDLSVLSGLGSRSPLLATALTLAVVSLAGIPPLAGFFGKFLLFKSVAALGATDPLYRVLLGVAVVGVVISLYYYFGVIRAIFWGPNPDRTPTPVPLPARFALVFCLAGMFWLGVLPDTGLKLADNAVQVLRPVAPDHALVGLGHR